MSYARPKTRYTDHPQACIVKLAEGSLAGETVLRKLLDKSHIIDPSNFFGPRAAFYALDGLHIYGERIVQLYRDVCQSNVVDVLALLRAVQLDMLPAGKLAAAIDAGSFDPSSLRSIVDLVTQQVPDFGRYVDATLGDHLAGRKKLHRAGIDYVV